MAKKRGAMRFERRVQLLYDVRQVLNLRTGMHDDNFLVRLRILVDVLDELARTWAAEMVAADAACFPKSAVWKKVNTNE